MRLGLLADIHEAVEPLRAAVRELQARRFSTPEQRIAGMLRCTHSRVFTGHLHEWGLFTPERQVGWIGEGPFSYRTGERYLTTVHAVCEGWCAVMDTRHDELVPIKVAAPPERLRGAEGL